MREWKGKGFRVLEKGMIREVKFRGLSEESREFVYGSFLSQYFSTAYGRQLDAIVYLDIDNGRQPRIPIIRETLGQFTGLRDFENKEIYEGDIVVFNPRFERIDGKQFDTAEVVKWCQVGASDDMGTDMVGFMEHWAGKTVIGNIHENPELLQIRA
jgi:uncharacterized phage protein (TIGR01671 family)